MSKVELRYNIHTEDLNTQLPSELIGTELPIKNRSSDMEITQKLLKEKFNYNPDTGIFTRIKKVGGLYGQIGSIAGYRNYRGYIVINLKGVPRGAHRLAWLYTYGYLPKEEIDHINGIRDDNRLCNLREVNSAENRKNMCIRSDNNSGTTGVYFKKDKKKWCARIHVNGKNKHIGYFDTKEEAILARKQAEKEYQYHPNHGRRRNYEYTN